MQSGCHLRGRGGLCREILCSGFKGLGFRVLVSGFRLGDSGSLQMPVFVAILVLSGKSVSAAVSWGPAEDVVNPTHIYL